MNNSLNKYGVLRRLEEREGSIFKVWMGLLKEELSCERGDFGIGSLIGVAIGLIIAAFVLIPGLRTFASTIITDMTSWWSTTVSDQVFPK